MKVKVLVGDATSRLRELPDESVHMCVTSPPYWGLRAYKGDSGMIGLEETFDEHLENLLAVFREVRRVLRDDGLLFTNYGDAYAGGGRGPGSGKQPTNVGSNLPPFNPEGWKAKDLMMMPARVAMALQFDGADIGAIRAIQRAQTAIHDAYDGQPPDKAMAALEALAVEYTEAKGNSWWLRSMIPLIKCLSGGTWLYAKTQKGVGIHMLKDLVRLEPSTVQLWNGEKWTRVLSWQRTPRVGRPLELVLRSGERIGCTPEHQWPTQRGLICTKDLVQGDIIKSCQLPETGTEPPWLTDDALWFAGLYLAEGSRSGDTIQISGHVKETERWHRITRLCEHYGAKPRRYNHVGKSENIHIDKPQALWAILNTCLSGRTAKDKRFGDIWGWSNRALRLIIEGYLEGDASKSKYTFFLGFTRNYALERDLRCAASRLGAKITVKPTLRTFDGKKYPSFNGTWIWSRPKHPNDRDRFEVREIRNSRARVFWDVAVEGEPHLFALASGVLTHNSNPMPESARDRPTNAVEYFFMFAKSGKAQFWTHPTLTGVRKLPDPDYFWRNRDTNVETEDEPDQWRELMTKDGKRKLWRRINRWEGHNYFYDNVAVQTQQQERSYKMPDGWDTGSGAHGKVHREGREKGKPAKTDKQSGHGPRHAGFNERWKESQYRKSYEPGDGKDFESTGAQNAREVKQRIVEGVRSGAIQGASMRNYLIVSTESYKDAHFATFGTKWIEPWIKAGTSAKGVCPECGAPWNRQSAVVGSVRTGGDCPRGDHPPNSSPDSGELGLTKFNETTGWLPTCECPEHKPVPATVLDPFAGSGTTGQVALQLNRDAVLVEISPDYVEFIKKRTKDEFGMLCEWEIL